MDETSRRDAIIDELLPHLSDVGAEAVLLAGSMGYGRGHCVTSRSDIDLLILLEASSICDIKRTSPFSEGIVTLAAQRAFADGEADTMWDWLSIDGVDINPGYINRSFFDSWTGLRATEIRRNRSDLPSGMQVGSNQMLKATANGREVSYTEEVTFSGGRYTVTKPVFVEGELLFDMLYGSVLLSQVMLDTSEGIAGQIAGLRDSIKQTYGCTGLLPLLEYGLRKASSGYVKDYLSRVGCDAHISSFLPGEA